MRGGRFGAILFLSAIVLGACVHRVETKADLPPGPRAAAEPAPVDPNLTPADRTIRMDPVVIKASPAQVAISDLNDEELFAIGTAAAAAHDDTKAALHFERLADYFPASPRRPAALHRAGLALERMKDHAGALGRYTDAAKAYGDTPEGVESRFKAADQYYFLGEFDAAADVIEAMLAMNALSAARRAEAANKHAILLYQSGRLIDAERALRANIAQMQSELKSELSDGVLLSQAQFYLAEVFRTHFIHVNLDPERQTQDEMMQELEYKAELLLSAQGHYLRCIRMGHPEWATASGFRIGELYQKLHEQLVDAKVPSDLDGEQAEIYREELRKKIKVLVVKAIDIYEKTLSTAERVGATNPFVSQTREQLDRMKALMLRDDATASQPEPAKSEPAPAETPGKG